MDKLERFIFQEGCTMWAVSDSLVDNIYSSSLIGYQLQHVCTMVLLDVVNPRVPTNARHGSSFTEYEKKTVMSQTSVRCLTQKLLTQVPDVCTSTNTETIELSPIRLSFDRRRKY